MPLEELKAGGQPRLFSQTRVSDFQLLKNVFFHKCCSVTPVVDLEVGNYKPSLQVFIV